ncbi:MAG: hypothetical protein P8J59_08720, partial [Phycisphaerales bacterium]|nr:hypothetical protein [Phycisphaerales bacterium]
MTDTAPSLDVETTSPPDLLGSMGAARRRLDDLTRETSAESIAATTEGDGAEEAERRAHVENAADIERTRDEGIETAARDRATETASAQQTRTDRLQEIDEDSEAMSIRIRR